MCAPRIYPQAKQTLAEGSEMSSEVILGRRQISCHIKYSLLFPFQEETGNTNLKNEK